MEPNLIEVKTQYCKDLKVYVQGNLEEKQGKTIILTVHDLGTNHRSFVDFVNQTCMEDVKARSVFLHVCVPGQDDNDADWEGEFPTMTQMGTDLEKVLEHFGVRTCIAMGEGAGANIVCRFAISCPNRVLGVCLIHCTSTTSGVLEYLKDKVVTWRLETSGMNQAAWDYLAFHKFGQAQNEDQAKKYMTDLMQRQNPGNLSRFINSFQKRTDLAASLARELKLDSLLVVGSKASHLHTVYTMHQAMARDKGTLLVVDGVGDVVSEAPDRLTRALVLFAKGCGVLGGVSIPGMERQRTLSNSMEEADRAQPRKFSTTK